MQKYFWLQISVIFSQKKICQMKLEVKRLVISVWVFFFSYLQKNNKFSANNVNRSE